MTLTLDPIFDPATQLRAITGQLLPYERFSTKLINFPCIESHESQCQITRFDDGAIRLDISDDFYPTLLGCKLERGSGVLKFHGAEAEIHVPQAINQIWRVTECEGRKVRGDACFLPSHDGLIIVGPRLLCFTELPHTVKALALEALQPGRTYQERCSGEYYSDAYLRVYYDQTMMVRFTLAHPASLCHEQVKVYIGKNGETQSVDRDSDGIFPGDLIESTVGKIILASLEEEHNLVAGRW